MRKEWASLIISVVDFIATVIALLGVGVIIWGVSVNFLRFVGAERRFLLDGTGMRERERIRHCLGFYLLLGLEFLIGADIMRTIARPSLQEVAVLAGIVLIRTVISLSLNREMVSGMARKKA